MLTNALNCSWFQGKLDRFEAERRLKSCGRPGSYLVRESDRKVNAYVLSYLGVHGINHFRITAVCGDYYIGERRCVANRIGSNWLSLQAAESSSRCRIWSDTT